MPLRLWLVEDEPASRRSFEAIAAASDAFVLERAFGRAEDLPLDAHDPPDLVVMDLGLPGVGGVEATRRLRRAMPATRVVVLTFLDDPAHVFAALRAGASGYVVKGSRPDEVVRALLDAHAGGTWFSPAVGRHVLAFFSGPAPAAPLTERELDVLRELAAGRSKARIGDALGISRHTVDAHLRAVYGKLEVRTAAGAVARAIGGGLIDPPR